MAATALAAFPLAGSVHLKGFVCPAQPPSHAVDGLSSLCEFHKKSDF
jgi:hypothetical protein